MRRAGAFAFGILTCHITCTYRPPAGPPPTRTPERWGTVSAVPLQFGTAVPRRARARRPRVRVPRARRGRGGKATTDNSPAWRRCAAPRPAANAAARLRTHLLDAIGLSHAASADPAVQPQHGAPPGTTHTADIHPSLKRTHAHTHTHRPRRWPHATHDSHSAIRNASSRSTPRLQAKCAPTAPL